MDSIKHNDLPNEKIEKITSDEIEHNQMTVTSLSEQPLLDQEQFKSAAIQISTTKVIFENRKKLLIFYYVFPYTSFSLSKYFYGLQIHIYRDQTTRSLVLQP